MKTISQKSLKRLVGVVAIGCALIFPVAAQTWPTKPVKVVVNFPPGGAADQLARIITLPLQEVLGQPVVVENRGGAGGNIGAEAVVKSPADGYTLLLSSGSTISVNPHIYPKMPFDPVKDLASVAAVARVPVYLVVKSGKLPGVNTVQDFIAYLKANPGKLSYGSPGSGSAPHLAAEMFKKELGVYAVHVPYRGAGPAMIDLLAGQIDFSFDTGAAFPHVKAGRLKMLAVGSMKRAPVFPDVPTLNEVGLKNFDATTIFGIYAPAGTPPDIVLKLNRDIDRVLETSAVGDRIAAMGGDAAPMTSAQFDAVVQVDSKRFGSIIRERKIVGD